MCNFSSIKVERELIICVQKIVQYTEVGEVGEEYEAIKSACDMAERLLDHINETIRDEEGADTLRKVSQHLWLGEGYVSPCF